MEQVGRPQIWTDPIAFNKAIDDYFNGLTSLEKKEFNYVSWYMNMKNRFGSDGVISKKFKIK